MASFFPVIYMMEDKASKYNENVFGIACDPEELPTGVTIQIIMTNANKDCLDAIKKAIKAYKSLK